MINTETYNKVFNKAIDDYHVTDNVDTPINNPYDRDTLENRLYLKCWIDTVQWHLEDLIRDPHIDPLEALALKRRIDRSNQDRTDLVEQIDSYFLHHFSDVKVKEGARINTESPAWAIDRLSSRWSARMPTLRTRSAAGRNYPCCSNSSATSPLPSTSSSTT